MSDFTLPIRDDLVGVQSYGAPQLDVAAPMNVNENPFGPSPALAAAMAAAVEKVAATLNRYPDRDADELRAALASYVTRETGVAVTAAQTWAANGSNEVMHHIFLAFGGPGRLAITFDPTYSMYPEYARDTFTEYRTFARRDDFTVDVDAAIASITELRPSIVLLTSPNNPTGTFLDFADAERIAAACLVAGAMLVVDEAYAEFRRAGTRTAFELLAEYPNVIVSRTMSKAFALAGARLGYAVAADTRVIDVLKVVRLPYHLSAVTQAVALTALDFADELQAQVDLLRSERDSLAAKGAKFIEVHIPTNEPSAATASLIDHGFSFAGFLPEMRGHTDLLLLQWIADPRIERDKWALLNDHLERLADAIVDQAHLAAERR
jgi:histidinol-phosphate aminotransferase